MSTIEEWQHVFTVEVFGVPITQGSMKAFVPRNSRRAIVTHANFGALGPWRNQVGDVVRRASPSELLAGPVRVALVFTFERPRAHFRKRRDGDVLRADAPAYAEAGKDGDKLERAVWDAMTGNAYRDDRQVVDWRGRKVYLGAPRAMLRPGVRIRLDRLVGAVANL